ncbi:hypothetical protein SNEBB_009977 [Seison nebaliae]|nr:hypothetical protein SNEBB_009977 [Seison nebaliae]
MVNIPSLFVENKWEISTEKLSWSKLCRDAELLENDTIIYIIREGKDLIENSMNFLSSRADNDELSLFLDQMDYQIRLSVYHQLNKESTIDGIDWMIDPLIGERFEGRFFNNLPDTVDNVERLSLNDFIYLPMILRMMINLFLSWDNSSVENEETTSNEIVNKLPQILYVCSNKEECHMIYRIYNEFFSKIHMSRFLKTHKKIGPTVKRLDLLNEMLTDQMNIDTSSKGKKVLFDELNSFIEKTNDSNEMEMNELLQKKVDLETELARLEKSSKIIKSNDSYQLKDYRLYSNILIISEGDLNYILTHDTFDGAINVLQRFWPNVQSIHYHSINLNVFYTSKDLLENKEKSRRINELKEFQRIFNHHKNFVKEMESKSIPLKNELQIIIRTSFYNPIIRNVLEKIYDSKKIHINSMDVIESMMIDDRLTFTFDRQIDKEKKLIILSKTNENFRNLDSKLIRNGTYKIVHFDEIFQIFSNDYLKEFENVHFFMMIGENRLLIKQQQNALKLVNYLMKLKNCGKMIIHCQIRNNAYLKFFSLNKRLLEQIIIHSFESSTDFERTQRQLTKSLILRESLKNVNLVDLCININQMGVCPNIINCEGKHYYEKDKKDTNPSLTVDLAGYDVSCEITHFVDSAQSFYVRLTRINQNQLQNQINRVNGMRENDGSGKYIQEYCQSSTIFMKMQNAQLKRHLCKLNLSNLKKGFMYIWRGSVNDEKPQLYRCLVTNIHYIDTLSDQLKSLIETDRSIFTCLTHNYKSFSQFNDDNMTIKIVKSASDNKSKKSDRLNYFSVKLIDIGKVIHFNKTSDFTDLKFFLILNQLRFVPPQAFRCTLVGLENNRFNISNKQIKWNVFAWDKLEEWLKPFHIFTTVNEEEEQSNDLNTNIQEKINNENEEVQKKRLKLTSNFQKNRILNIRIVLVMQHNYMWITTANEIIRSPTLPVMYLNCLKKSLLSNNASITTSSKLYYEHLKNLFEFFQHQEISKGVKEFLELNIVNVLLASEVCSFLTIKQRNELLRKFIINDFHNMFDSLTTKNHVTYLSIDYLNTKMTNYRNQFRRKNLVLFSSQISMDDKEFASINVIHENFFRFMGKNFNEKLFYYFDDLTKKNMENLLLVDDLMKQIDKEHIYLIISPVTIDKTKKYRRCIVRNFMVNDNQIMNDDKNKGNNNENLNRFQMLYRQIERMNEIVGGEGETMNKKTDKNAYYLQYYLNQIKSLTIDLYDIDRLETFSFSKSSLELNKVKFFMLDERVPNIFPPILFRYPSNLLSFDKFTENSVFILETDEIFGSVDVELALFGSDDAVNSLKFLYLSEEHSKTIITLTYDYNKLSLFNESELTKLFVDRISQLNNEKKLPCLVSSTLYQLYCLRFQFVLHQSSQTLMGNTYEIISKIISNGNLENLNLNDEIEKIINHIIDSNKSENSVNQTWCNLFEHEQFDDDDYYGNNQETNEKTNSVLIDNELLFTLSILHYFVYANLKFTSKLLNKQLSIILKVCKFMDTYIRMFLQGLIKNSVDGEKFPQLFLIYQVILTSIKELQHIFQSQQTTITTKSKEIYQIQIYFSLFKKEYNDLIQQLVKENYETYPTRKLVEKISLDKDQLFHYQQFPNSLNKHSDVENEILQYNELRSFTLTKNVGGVPPEVFDKYTVAYEMEQTRPNNDDDDLINEDGDEIDDGDEWF